MAIPKVLKTITNHQKLCEIAEQFVTTHRPLLDEALASVFRRDLPEGQAPPDVGAFIDGMLRRLRGALQDMTVAEEKHLNELSNDGAFRKLRDNAVSALREAVITMRTQFRTVYGEDKTRELGFESEIAQHPLSLLRQTSRLLGKLRDPEIVLPPPRYPSGAVPDREAVADLLEPLALDLRTVVSYVTVEYTKAQGTQVDKDQKTGAFVETFNLFVNMLQAAFRLAGHPELARRLRRSVNRRTSQSGEEAAAPDAGDSEEEVEEGDDEEDEETGQPDD